MTEPPTPDRRIASRFPVQLVHRDLPRQPWGQLRLNDGSMFRKAPSRENTLDRRNVIIGGTSPPDIPLLDGEQDLPCRWQLGALPVFRDGWKGDDTHFAQRFW